MTSGLDTFVAQADAADALKVREERFFPFVDFFLTGALTSLQCGGFRRSLVSQCSLPSDRGKCLVLNV